ncbi:MAG: YfhO family protein, partial [Candidatus Omnitrophica bacterium]|nr:YfhO family protein [Candidatus Omnitrophota bacterium]
NMYWGIDNIGVYSPLIFNRYQEMLGDLGCVDDSTGITAASEEALRKNLPLLGMLNVKYVISQDEIEDKYLEPLYDTGDGRKIYVNRLCMPRAFIAHRAKKISNASAVLSYIKEGRFDPGDAVILEEDPPGGMGEYVYPGSRKDVVISKYTDSDIMIMTDTDADGILVLSDYYYPGWEADLDGKRTKIFRANYMVRAVLVPKGRHEVRFKYSNPII